MGGTDDEMKFEKLVRPIMMVLLGYLLVIIAMSYKGDMPTISQLTTSERFVFFYVFLVFTSVAIPDYGRFVT